MAQVSVGNPHFVSVVHQDHHTYLTAASCMTHQGNPHMTHCFDAQQRLTGVTEGRHCMFTGASTAEAVHCHVQACVPVIPGQNQPAIRHQQSVALFKSKVCVHQMDAVHDCHKGGHPARLSHLLVHVGCADAVDGHSALQRLGVSFG